MKKETKKKGKIETLFGGSAVRACAVPYFYWLPGRRDFGFQPPPQVARDAADGPTSAGPGRVQPVALPGGNFFQPLPVNYL